MTGRQPFRKADGGRIDRSRSINFRFDGKNLQGYAGDTLASALLASGVRLVGRSFKYHRPRGIYTAGIEEPNALVELRDGARQEPNTPATQIELFEGLTAKSQHRWPSLQFDIAAVTSLLSPLFPAGFYYKTFMWPRSAWLKYEALIRRAAGLGAASEAPDPDRYEKIHEHCDVAVIGSGPAGLAAALTAGRSGARVVLVEQDREPGGSLLFERLAIDGLPAEVWRAAAVAELEAMSNVRLLTRTTAFGFYDHGTLGLVERVADHLPETQTFQPRQRLWTLRSRRVVLATGAIERPLVFAGNDRPGVMLAAAARHYLNRYAVLPGQRAVVFSSHDEGYRTAFDLADADIEVAAVVDPRPQVADDLASSLAKRGISHHPNCVVTRARGARALTGVDISALDARGAPDQKSVRVACDLLCVSGGWSPAIHLSSQTGARPTFDTEFGAFLPGPPRQAECSVGAAAGRFTLAECLKDGAKAGLETASTCGHQGGEPWSMPACEPEAEARPLPLWEIPGKGGKAFVDLQDDVTADDVRLAAREGYRSVEHLKRYTTLGMGTDQGKTANVNGLAILAEARGDAIEQVGLTTFRPPFTPVALGVFAGRDVGRHYRPTRRSPMHDWHLANGAVMVEQGLWLRPQYYPRSGEGLFEAMNREARHVREKVGIVDVSTLGKIDVQGPDSAEFLNRVYTNGWKTLPIGKARYGLMLREDGMVFDDGTCSRLGERHYFMTTTTANAAAVLSHLEFLLQAVWPELKVHVASITDQYAAMALAGPLARTVLASAIEDNDVSDASLPFMGVIRGRIAGRPVLVFRISFSGELAYEIATPADHGTTVWEAVLKAGQDCEIVPYGLEAMSALRIEKGHVAGGELNGQTTPDDLGLAKLCSSKKDYVGRRMLERPALQDPRRPRLVGLEATDGRSPIPAGSQLVEQPDGQPPVTMLGHVTSYTWSANLDKPIALALLSGAAERLGTTIYAADPLGGRTTACHVVSPHFLDPEGKRLHG